MVVNKLDISNLNGLYKFEQVKEEYANKKNLTVTTFGLRSSEVYDKIKLTFSLSEVSALEALYLKKICSFIRIYNPGAISEEQLSQYNLEEDYIDAMEEMHNFIMQVESERDLSLSYMYDVILNVGFDVVCVISGNMIEDFFGRDIVESIRRIIDLSTGDTALLTEQEFNDNKEEIYSKIVRSFITHMYMGMTSEYEALDPPVNTFMYNEYFKLANQTSARLVRCNGPFGISPHFIMTDKGDDGNIASFSPEAISLIKEEKVEEEVDLYFVVNSSFFTYMRFMLDWGLDADCNLIRELIMTEMMYAEPVLIDRYQARLNKFIAPLMQQRLYIRTPRPNEKEQPTSIYKMMFATFNTSITYLLKVNYTKWHLFEEYIANENEFTGDTGDFEQIVENIYDAGKVIIGNLRG